MAPKKSKKAALQALLGATADLLKHAGDLLGEPEEAEEPSDEEQRAPAGRKRRAAGAAPDARAAQPKKRRQSRAQQLQEQTDAWAARRQQEQDDARAEHDAASVEMWDATETEREAFVGKHKYGRADPACGDTIETERREAMAEAYNAMRVGLETGLDAFAFSPRQLEQATQALHAYSVGRRSLLAGALLAVAAAGAAMLPGAHARAGPIPAQFTYWAGCEPPAYCQPATGAGLVSVEAASRVEAAAVIGNSSVQAAAALSGGYSKYWGVNGELFNPAGRITDYSFAGYKQGNEPLPSPPVTVSYKQFQQAGMSDTQALLAAVDWAHKQPYTTWCVIRIPAGTHILNRQIIIRRPRLILRGDGSATTILKVDNPLKDIPGVPKPKGGYGFYNQEAFINFRGQYLRDLALSKVTGTAARGDRLITVANASQLRVGQYVVLVLYDKGGALNRYLMNDRKEYKISGSHQNRLVVRCPVRITGIQGQYVALERPLPFAIRQEFAPELLPQKGTVYESGIEGVTFNFRWAFYGGHHYEDGYNAIEFREVYDCFARDIATVNADSCVFIDKCSGVQINNLKITQTKPRDPKKPKSLGDGHWGVHSGSSADVLVDGFVCDQGMLHVVGADAMSLFAVFTNGVMSNGNLELHRGLAGQTLFTNINVGIGDHAFQSGGPASSGPNTVAYTTAWNVFTSTGAAMPPPGSNTAKQGECSFGPDMTFVGVKLKGQFCPTWAYEAIPNPVNPPNLYKAMRDKRMGARKAG
ncbi:band 7 [Chlorella sorokiniana]|uniref:Band 7 n=1 Tax=Chlorella sorokiniana TaxID=3076 RepID=A0A2P6TSN6_CHLSO|nr:band 7 [Chlorella sorokiniana]|eukprot:PRW57063.1 band 7 [Chlorella sorokiniana]